MKRFTLVAAAALVLLVPTLAGASNGFVYRPELRQWIPVAPRPSAQVVTQSVKDVMSRHQQMAQAFRGTRMAQSAVHCDRLVAQLREERKHN